MPNASGLFWAKSHFGMSGKYCDVMAINCDTCTVEHREKCFCWAHRAVAEQRREAPHLQPQWTRARRTKLAYPGALHSGGRMRVWNEKGATFVDVEFVAWDELWVRAKGIRHATSAFVQLETLENELRLKMNATLDQNYDQFNRLASKYICFLHFLRLQPLCVPSVLHSTWHSTYIAFTVGCKAQISFYSGQQVMWVCTVLLWTSGFVFSQLYKLICFNLQRNVRVQAHFSHCIQGRSYHRGRGPWPIPPIGLAPKHLGN